MEVKVVLLIVSFVSCGLTRGGEQETSPKNYGGKDPLSYIPSIPELSTSIKDPVVWKNGTRLLFFYTPWCSYSQFMKPLLYQLIEQLYYLNVSGILVGQLDVSIHSDVARIFRIKATPTLLLLQNGTRYEFIDEVTVDNMIQFVIKVLSPSLTEVINAVEVQEVLDQRSVVFLLIHDEEINDEWQVVYTRVSQERVLIGHFLYTTNTDIPSDMGFNVRSLPAVVVLKDNQSYLYTDTLSKYRMTLWVESEQFPSLPTANSSTLRYFMHAGLVKRLVILVLASKQHRSIAHKKAYEAVKRVATSRKLHSGYQFLILEDKDIAERIVQMSLTLPALFVWEHHTGYYFLHEEKTYTEKGVASFLFSVTAGKIQALGGPTYWTTLHNCYWWSYNLLQIMLFHRPILSILAIVLFLAGFIIFVYTRWTRPKPTPKQNRQEAITRERARQRLRRNQTRRQREPQLSSEDGTTDEEKKDQ